MSKWRIVQTLRTLHAIYSGSRWVRDRPAFHFPVYKHRKCSLFWTNWIPFYNVLHNGKCHKTGMWPHFGNLQHLRSTKITVTTLSLMSNVMLSYARISDLVVMHKPYNGDNIIYLTSLFSYFFISEKNTRIYFLKLWNLIYFSTDVGMFDKLPYFTYCADEINLSVPGLSRTVLTNVCKLYLLNGTTVHK